MKYFYRTVLYVTFLLLTLMATSLFSLTIKLQNGSCLQGEIVSSDETSFEFKRWDTGGLITFKWEQLPPEESQRIRNLLNIRILGDEVSAFKAYIKNGEIIMGIILEETNRYINLKTRNGVKNILKDSILGSEFVKINILDVYSPEEIYEIEIKRYNLNQAEDCYKLAEYCFARLGLLDKARELFSKSAALDERYREKAYLQIKIINNEFCSNEIKRISSILDKGDIKNGRIMVDNLKNQQILKADTEIQALIQGIEQKVTDAEKKEKEQKEKDLVKKTLDEWYKIMDTSLNQIASNTKVTYPNIIAYVKQFLFKEITSKAAKNLEMKEENIQKLWITRTINVSTKKTASYGDGTFIVTPTPPVPPYESIEEYANYQEKMRLINDAKRDALRKRTTLNADGWWSRASVSVKQNWLEAYVAERQMKIIDKKMTPCQNCHGEGIIRKSNQVIELCNRCQGCTVDITIIYY